MNTLSPKFISFEGTEGVGKTTAIDGFCRWLDELGIDHIRTREPGGSVLAEKLRQILLDNESDLHDDTELLLIFTARNDHIHKIILPALTDNKWVICDRFIDSTVAYQGFGRHKGDFDALIKIDKLIERFVPRLPDMTFWLDLDIRTGRQRALARSSADRFENNDDDFFGRVYEGFFHQYTTNSNRIHRINAHQSPNDVIADIITQLTYDGHGIDKLTNC